MEEITIGQVALFLAFIAGILTSFGVIYKFIKKWLNKLFTDQLKNIDEKMKAIEKRVDEADLESCKNYLVTFLSDLERGKTFDEIEVQRFWEQYEHYKNRGGNSYIRHRVDVMKNNGKL